MCEKEFILTSKYFEREMFFIYDIICFMLQKYNTTGILKVFSKQELLDVFPWKRTQLQLYLQKIIKQEVLIYHNRKYLLNLKNQWVIRLWNYFFASNELNEEKFDDLGRNIILFGEKNKLEEEIEIIFEKIKRCYRSINIEDIKNLQSEIQNILFDLGYDRDSLFYTCKENLTLLLGFI